MTSLRTLVLPLLLAATLVGCSASEPADTDIRESMPAAVNEVDLHFLGMMTPHHVQAVDMSDIILAAENISEPTRDLARRISAGQSEEIRTMTEWASEWDQGAVMQMHAPHVANGMLTAEQLEGLASVTGPEAERLFLELMHAHHEGALAMTRDEVSGGGYPELTTLAQHMIDVQTAEMAEMTQLLAG